ncbi:hypothetical protein PHLGIDRAFT_329130 [Phlebiopsis gigantea 11061_1 CR5-6]|uniref:Nudix hydrolase domain-containing protein n=1 Tax=Phlebiopsis gigantea (strain 11061_1 CR5-6) TaxID=745531 RepID=A0A0C3S7A6_PHLG1|nr:hypothetical protein PHLGIDRAFT_329130 [Phlebiopsis gigantea 11061_1 CR5-6]
MALNSGIHPEPAAAHGTRTTNGASSSTTRTTTVAQHLAGSFVISSGSTLFRRAADSGELQLCVLHQPQKNKYVLPKGRKDFGESIEAACLRETFEETGYPCEFVPLRMATRATAPGDVRARDDAVTRDDMLEPVGVTVQDRGKKGGKLIMWYVTRVLDGAVRQDGTQMDSECFESQFLKAERAIPMLTAQEHRDLAAQALELIRTTEAILGRNVI